MMGILQIVILGLVAAILSIIIKEQRPEIAMQISIGAGALIFLMVIGNLTGIFEVIQDMAAKANIDEIYLKTIFKIVGIAYVAEFGSQVCKDAGEGAIATKIEIGAKIIIMMLAIPILMALMEMVIKIMP
jgi:stage III sporulation protein AD